MELENLSVECKKPRLKYDRGEMLEFKGGLDLSDEFSKNVAAVTRTLRGKQKQNTTYKPQITDRNRDTSNIVLGPQKRTWNTGCHVSNLNSPESQNGHSSNRNGKYTSEHHSDRLHHPSPSDYKRDYRGGFHNRDRTNNKRDATSYYRSRKDEVSRPYFEEEPEWFSGGPSTVNETIELGGIPDDCDEKFPQTKKCEDRNKIKEINNQAGSSQIPQTGPDLYSSQSVSVAKLDSKASLQLSSDSGSSQGSRFKHLFCKTGTEEGVTSSVNEQLQQLLKISKPLKPGPNSPERKDVLQVENKLRSILLGHNASQRPQCDQSQSHNKTSKSQALTVEEIESQLNLRKNDNVTRQSSDNPPTGEQLSNVKQNQLNWAPFLQTLMKTSQSTSRAVALTSVSAIPHQTNAISASARINQLQQGDPLNPSALTDETLQQQGLLREIWNTDQKLNIESSRISSQFPVSQPSLLQRLNVSCSAPLSDSALRTCFVNSSNIDPMLSVQASMRKPILKSQVTPAADNSQFYDIPYSSQPQVTGQRLDRQLFNLAFKQQQQRTKDSSFALPNMPFGNTNAYPDMHRKEFRLNNPSATLLAATAANNNNVYRSPSSQTDNNTTAIFNNFSTWDRMVTHTQASEQFASRNSNVRTATLEEIEHLGVVGGGPYF